MMHGQKNIVIIMMHIFILVWKSSLCYFEAMPDTVSS